MRFVGDLWGRVIEVEGVESRGDICGQSRGGRLGTKSFRFQSCFRKVRLGRWVRVQEGVLLVGTKGSFSNRRSIQEMLVGFKGRFGGCQFFCLGSWFYSYCSNFRKCLYVFFRIEAWRRSSGCYFFEVVLEKQY